jgi:hypothetical protein
VLKEGEAGRPSKAGEHRRFLIDMEERRMKKSDDVVETNHETSGKKERQVVSRVLLLEIAGRE